MVLLFSILTLLTNGRKMSKFSMAHVQRVNNSFVEQALAHQVGAEDLSRYELPTYSWRLLQKAGCTVRQRE